MELPEHSIPIFRRDYAILTSLIVFMLSTGTAFYMSVEGWRLLDSLYFSVTTLTTLGYGDFAPKTDAGKIFTIFYVFIGVGTTVAFINVVARHAINRYNPIRLLLRNETELLELLKAKQK